MNKNKHGIQWLDIAFLTVLAVYILAGISIAPFHGDESAYIWMSEDYDRVKNREFEMVFYTPEGNPKQYLRLTTGSILSYSIGFLRDITDNDDPIEKWLWGSSWEDNIAMGKMPTPGLLTMGRVVSALMGLGGIILFFFTAYQLSSSRMIAWAGTLLLATNGPVLVSIRRAMQEGPKFLFLILTIYAAVFILQNLQGMKMRWSQYAILGIASGLTLAAKQDTAPTLVAVYLALGLIPFLHKAGFRFFLLNILHLFAATLIAYAFFLLFMPVFWDWWETAIMLVGFALILFQLPQLKLERSAIPFVIAGLALMAGMSVRSPALWRDIPTPVLAMLETRKGVLAGQGVVIGESNQFEADSMKNRLGFLVENTVSSDAMYMEMANFDIPTYHELIDAYEASLLSGRIGSLWIDGLILILAVIGVWMLIKPFTGEGFFILSLFFITASLLYLLISLSWQRYFIIMQIPYSLLGGFGACQVWLWASRLLNQKQSME
jgi:hypothetical protein